MPAEEQPADPAADLLAAARLTVPAWLRRATEDACRRGGVDPQPLEHELGAAAERAADDVLGRLATLLATDVDRQRTTPLSLLRDAVVAGPTRFLRDHDVPPPPQPGEGHPDDVYGLGPATWSDVDPRLHEPGLTWGAWKAMTVLARRRDDGLR